MKPVRSPELTAAYAHCREIARREAKNFYYAFLALPAPKSDAMCAVYAFMRRADDLADDESLSLDERRAAMAAWTTEWRDSRHTSSDDPVFLAVNDVQQRFGISDDLLDQLIAGTTLDLQPQPEGVLLHTLTDGRTLQVYESFAALHHYCYLVASVVGLVTIRIFGIQGRGPGTGAPVVSPEERRADQLAIETGVAFQLTNILRDVREDAERGRIYLSADLLREHGVTPERIAALSSGATPAAADLALLTAVERQAQSLYRSAGSLVPLLEPEARPAMRVLVRIYHRLLDRIAADPAAVFRERVSVPTAEKLGILAMGMVGSLKARWLG